MGSRVYAAACRERGDRIVGMFALEMLGCYSEEEGSQRFPFAPLALFYPSRGNFIGFIGNVSSRHLVRDALSRFRRLGGFPSEGLCSPNIVQGIGWSDHSSFWHEGYRAAMVSDTALFRDTTYHTPEDTLDRIDTARMAQVVVRLAEVFAAMADEAG